MKSLVDNLFKGVKKGFLIATAATTLGFLSGCPINPEPNSPPTVNLSTNPSSGDAPLETRLQLNCEDSDDDIVGYVLRANGETISRESPIDIIKTFNQDTTVYGKCMDSDGATDEIEKTIDVNSIYISGQLQDNERDTGKQGVIRVYDPNNNNKSLKDINGEQIIETDSEGNFDFYINKKELESDEILLQARIDNDSDGNWDSYVRTRTLPGEDNSGLVVRAVPHPGKGEFGITYLTPQEFRDDYVLSILGVGVPLSRWDLGDEGTNTPLEGIEILKYNPNNNAYFSDREQQFIKERIIGDDDVEAVLEGKELDSYVDIVDHQTNSSKEGWKAIIPAELENNVAGDTDNDWNTDYYYTHSRIRININNFEADTSEGSALVSHEVVHGLGFYAGHPDKNNSNICPDNSIMCLEYNSSSPTTPTLLDKKGSRLIYEENYKTGEEVDNNILGMNFY